MLPNTCGKQPLRVLLVDRSAETRDLFATLFVAMGYEVRTATSVGEALFHAPLFRPHAVFTSVLLPDGSGFDLCAALRKLPQTADALIIAITGHVAPDSAALAQEAGFDQYLVKPVGLPTILETMKSVTARAGNTAAPIADLPANRTTSA